MRKTVLLTILYVAGIQSVQAEVLTVAQDRAVDSDVVLESAVREIKDIPEDAVGIIGDGVTFVKDETLSAVHGVAAAFEVSPSTGTKKDALVEIANAWDSSDDIIFRSYEISEAVGNDLVQGDESDAVDVSGYFTGVAFPKGSSVWYRPEFTTLFVRQTQGNLLAIENILAELHRANRELLGQQVEIETKFVEVNQSVLKEMGFDWTFVSKDGGAAGLFQNLAVPGNQSILSDTLRNSATALSSGANPASLVVAKTAGSLQWSLLVNALEQSEDADVLSAPRIVTCDGETAVIEVGEERMVPREFYIDSVNTSIFVEHSGWGSELMGVQLEVTPELRDGGLIDLQLKPRVMDLLGYDDYQVSPDNATMILWQGQPYVNVGPRGRFPVLTQLADGTTSVIGGLYSNILNATFGTAVDINDTGTILGESANTFDDASDTAASPANSAYYTPSYGYFSQDRMPQHDTEGIAVPSLHGRLPYFRLREMETRVTVADGSTVGMGGLIYDKLETYRDKVPVLGSIPLLGRLFRSEGEKSVKRNLMIFVTATQIDMNGRRTVDMK